MGEGGRGWERVGEESNYGVLHRLLLVEVQLKIYLYVYFHSLLSLDNDELL